MPDCWIFKSALYSQHTDCGIALVTTNTVCQGGQVPVLWSAVESLGIRIAFAYTSFKWANLATHNAGITVIVIGLRRGLIGKAFLYDQVSRDVWQRRDVDCINGYLIAGPCAYVSPQPQPLSELPLLSFGNHPYYGADLILSKSEVRALIVSEPAIQEFIRPYYGSTEVIHGVSRYCIWMRDQQYSSAGIADVFADRFAAVRDARLKKSTDATARTLADKPYRFRDQVEARAARCTAKAKHSGLRCWRLGAHGGSVCTSHGYRPRQTVRCGAAHWNYQSKGETKTDRAKHSRVLNELRQIEALAFSMGLVAPGSKRWPGRKPRV